MSELNLDEEKDLTDQLFNNNIYNKIIEKNELEEVFL